MHVLFKEVLTMLSKPSMEMTCKPWLVATGTET